MHSLSAASIPTTDTEPPPAKQLSGGGQFMTVREAIETTERIICGPGALYERGGVAGLAALGLPAATLFAPVSAGNQASLREAVVHHEVWASGHDLVGTVPVLLAGTAQEAIDHCVLAHLLARRLKRPVRAQISPLLLERIFRVEIPAADQVNRVLTSVEPIETTEPLTRDHGLSEARDLCALLETKFGRPVRLLHSYHLDDATQLLLTPGQPDRHLQWLIDQFRRSGLPVGVLGVSLLSPATQSEVLSILGDRTCVFLEPGELDQPLLSSSIRLPPNRASVISASVGQSLAELLESVASEFHAPTPDADFPANGSSRAYGAAPAGPWADRLLRSIAAEATDHVEFCFRRHGRVAELHVASTDLPADGLHAVVVADWDLLLEAARRLLDGGTLLVVAETRSVEELRQQLSDAVRACFRDKNLQLAWIDPAALAAKTDRRAATSALAAALLSVVPVQQDARIVPAAELQIITEIGKKTPPRQEPSTSSPQPPRMPQELTIGTDADSWAAAIRTFHMTSDAPSTVSDPLGATVLCPAGFSELTAAAHSAAEYPLVLQETGATSLRELLRPLVGGLLQGNLDRLVVCFSRAASRHPRPVALSAVADEAFTLFRESLDLSAGTRKHLDEEIAGLRVIVPAKTRLLGLNLQTAFNLYLEAIQHERTSRRRKFRARVKTFSSRLNELLKLDAAHGPAATAPEALTQRLGTAADSLIDVQALSRILPAYRGTKRLSDARRKRIGNALRTLNNFLPDAESGRPIIICGDDCPCPTTDTVLVLPLAEPLPAAQAIFDAQAARMANVFRAARIAQLEIQGAYDSQTHDDFFRRFGPDMFNAEELLLLPAVAVIDHAARLRTDWLAPLGALLRSGRLVHVIGVEAAIPDASALNEYHAGLSQIASAYREALVVEGSLAHPIALLKDLGRVAVATRPSAVVIATPTSDCNCPPLVELSAAHHGRATTTFLHDPLAAANNRDRFDITSNPQCERAWPRIAVQLSEATEPKTLEVNWTFAHSAALRPTLRDQFWIIPPEAWSDEQRELSAQLNESPEVTRSVPFIWVIRDGVLARAIVTRELAFAASDRLRAWRLLQEQAGVDNTYARQAAAAARQQAREEAQEERHRLEIDHAEQLEAVRAAAAAESMQRLVQVLLEMDTVSVNAAPLAGPVAAANGQAASPAAQVKENPAPADDDTPAVKEDVPAAAVQIADEPYLDTDLCTSCDDCHDINPEMFKFNENKQAYLADPKAGTFEQLVLAAEKCPAHCIYPGAPRHDDPTATEEIRVRAAKLPG